MAKQSDDTYGKPAALETSLQKLQLILKSKGITRLFTKPLSPNDNSKNQIYLGGDLSSLNIIPVESFQALVSKSRKPGLKPDKDLIQGRVRFSWIDHSGHLYPAPEAKLILYPQYPEVRFSGFLKGSEANASEWMDPHKQGRSLGRFLLIGISPDGACIGYLATPGSQISKELNQIITSEDVLLHEISLDKGLETSSREKLLSELLRIHKASPIEGKKLNKMGIALPYAAANGAGYTLEAELGISPNGYAEPDYEGWEVKAHGGSVVTLMTPEPDRGLYQSSGIDSFVRTYGYPDKNGKPDRLNFGGIHRIGERQPTTKLTLQFSGYIFGQNGIDPMGGLLLVDDKDQIAAEWTFAKLLEHWNRKHAKAAYIPYKSLTSDKLRLYYYSNQVSLGVGTDFMKFLEAFARKSMYYDPGIKLVGASTSKPEIKRRSQFRIKSKSLETLYLKWETVTL